MFQVPERKYSDVSLHIGDAQSSQGAETGRMEGARSELCAAGQLIGQY